MSAIQRMVAVVVGVVVVLSGGSAARGEEFLKAVDLGPVRVMSVQDNQTLKTFETFARQRLAMITGKTSYNGVDAVPAILDMTFRPELYKDKNLIRIKSVPLRKDFAAFAGIDAKEKERILHEGTVSWHFMQRPDVQAFLEKLRSEAVFKDSAVGELANAALAFEDLLNAGGRFVPSAPVPPRAAGDLNWKHSPLVMPNVPRYAEMLKRAGAPLAEQKLPGYEGQEELLGDILDTQRELSGSWRDQSVPKVEAAAVRLAGLLQQVNPAVYPSEIKRKVEVTYNRLAKLTIPIAFVYFGSFVLFLLAVYSGVTGLRLWGLRLFTLAFLLHTVAIAVRWWLVSKSVGNWFESIPIKNQFESVLFSAWFGAAVGLGLELWRSKGIWGAAASFVGWLSLVAIFSAPFVAGRDIGGEIGMVSGVLMSYWLYIHVTMAVASYALIGMSFMLGAWWLLKYYGKYDQVRSVPQRQLAGDTSKLDDETPAFSAAMSAGTGGGALSALSFRQTLLALVFFPTARAEAKAEAKATRETLKSDALKLERTKSVMATLDACNLVILQLAFWILGVAIILGAVWADQSWGRPWGWDPKETFALVTWIVYLAVVHIRLATEHKAWWTAVLSIVGFFIMLFNWVGVNFFLVGLHSYA